MGKKRRIVDADIRFVSLVPRGANGLSVIYKAGATDPTHGTLVFHGFTKPLEKFEERGELAALVYVPDRVDHQDEWADSETVRKMAHGFLRNKGDVDMRHDEIAMEDAAIVESFIVQKGDPRFQGIKDDKGSEVDPTDGWGTIIKLDSDDLRKQYRNGEFGGVSMGGIGTIRLEDPPSKQTRKALETVIEKGEIEMDKQEMLDILKESNKTLLTEVKTEVTGQLKAAGLIKEKPVGDPPVEKTGEIEFPEDLDLTDENEVSKFLFEEDVRASLSEVTKAKGKAKIAALKKHQTKVAELRKQYGIEDATEEVDEAGNTVQPADDGNSTVSKGQAQSEWEYGRLNGQEINKELRREDTSRQRKLSDFHEAVPS